MLLLNTLDLVLHLLSKWGVSTAIAVLFSGIKYMTCDNDSKISYYLYLYTRNFTCSTDWGYNAHWSFCQVLCVKSISQSINHLKIPENTCLGCQRYSFLGKETIILLSITFNALCQGQSKEEKRLAGPYRWENLFFDLFPPKGDKNNINLPFVLYQLSVDF